MVCSEGRAHDLCETIVYYCQGGGEGAGAVIQLDDRRSAQLGWDLEGKGRGGAVQGAGCELRGL